MNIRNVLRRDDGTLTLFTAIAAIGLLAALGFIVDAGQKLQAGQQARAIAEEAARAGAGQVNRSAAYAHGGTFTTDPTAAAAAARVYLAASGHPVRERDANARHLGNFRWVREF